MGKAGGELWVVCGNCSRICKHVLSSLRKSSYRDYVCGYLSRHLTCTSTAWNFFLHVKRCFVCLFVRLYDTVLALAYQCSFPWLEEVDIIYPNTIIKK